jgi:hypothetical protein
MNTYFEVFPLKTTLAPSEETSNEEAWIPSGKMSLLSTWNVDKFQK